MTLFKDHIQEHLTSSPVDAFARASHPGMAHFAGTGPAGKSCRECVFWKHEPHAYRAKNGKYGGAIKPAVCMKYQQITLQEGSPVPDEARACKYFEQKDNPPPRYARS